MNFRFSLDNDLHTELITHLRNKYPNSSLNSAMKLYVIERRAIQVDKELTLIRQNIDSQASDTSQLSDSQQINLSSLDATFSELEE